MTSFEGDGSSPGRIARTDEPEASPPATPSRDDPARSAALVAELKALRTDDDEIARDVRLARLRAELLGDDTRPVQLGRYRTLALIGRGGMGVVLRAFDPDLDREVALKVLLPDARAPSDHARMLREARAMAQLSHPNLVAVYEIESGGDIPFIAMEYVVGETLQEWMRKRRSWREIVRTFVGAGRGLEAAHAAGIVHRDFKPSNVLIGRDGRARVTDFGLARQLDTSESPVSDGEVDPLPVVTRAGVIAGTPAYMAPEQHDGETLGAATDQYAYCVALFEALHGARPFRGGTMEALAVAKLRGAPRGQHPVPRWLQATIVRGLAPAASERWPSMGALLDVLERGQARARKRGWIFAGLTTAVAAGVVGLVHVRDVRAKTRACEEAGARITEVWNDDVGESMRAAFVASGVDDAARTADLAAPWLTARAAAWQEAQTEVCLDADVRHTTSPETEAAASWCLAERRMELEALVAELTRGDAVVIREAVVAAATLPGIESCTDPSVVGLPVEHPEAVLDLLEAMSRADAAQRTGRREEGLQRSRDARARAEEIGLPRLVVRARLLEARALERNGEYDEAERIASAAYFDAAALGEWDTAAAAASRLTYVVSYRRGRHDDALVWGRHAEVALTHAADPAGLRAAEIAAHLGTVHQAINDSEDAEALFERALEIYERALGSDHPSVANAINSIANLRKRAGDYEEARRLHERALDIRERILGPSHPDVGSSLIGLASVHWAQGDAVHALELDERALRIREAALGPDHPDVAACLVNTAGVLTDLGEHARAGEMLSRALAIYEHALGPEHPSVGATLVGLASTYEQLGDQSQARTALERGLAVLERALGPEHPEVGTALNNLGALYKRLGETAAAQASYERALRIAERALGPEHPQVALALANLRGLHADAGDTSTAEALAERAVGIYDAHEGEQRGEAAERFALARLLLVRDAARARRLAEQARDAWRNAARTDELTAVETWLTQNFGP